MTTQADLGTGFFSQVQAWFPVADDSRLFFRVGEVMQLLAARQTGTRFE
jgi:hypothetical protein